MDALTKKHWIVAEFLPSRFSDRTLGYRFPVNQPFPFPSFEKAEGYAKARAVLNVPCLVYEVVERVSLDKPEPPIKVEKIT